MAREIGVVAAAGAAGIGEDEDALLVVHEGLRLGEVGRAGAVLDGKTACLALAHDAARAAGDLGDHVGAEALDDLVERALHGRQRGELFDQRVAARDGLAALTGWPSR